MDAVANYDNGVNSIGYSVYAYAANMYGTGTELKFIKVDGVDPTDITIDNSSYLLLGYNYAIYNARDGKDSKAAKLVEWLLTEDGKSAIKDAEYKVAKTNKYTFGKIGTGIEKNESLINGKYTSVITNDDDMSSVIHRNKSQCLYSNYSQIPADTRIYGKDSVLCLLELIKDKSVSEKLKEFVQDSIINLENKYSSEIKMYIGTQSEYLHQVEAMAEQINGYLSIVVYYGGNIEKQTTKY